MNNYRPWGTLSWLLSKLHPLSWDMVGCIGTEYRSLEVFKLLSASGNLNTIKFLKILDDDYDYSQKTKDCLNTRIDEAKKFRKIDEDTIEKHYLLETHDEILSPVEEYVKNKKNIILDVSSMPKRFFFPILKILLLDNFIENLIVTYTVPKSYREGKLAKNLTDWAHLPLFSGGSNYQQPDMLCVGVGFDPMGIQNAISPEGHGVPIKFFFPFPAPLSSTKRAWEFVRNIEKGRTKEKGNLEVLRVEAKNPSDTFNRLCALRKKSKNRIELAPFGPKAISVAMCIYATITESEVFYTQPKQYEVDYSEGVSEVYAYSIKLHGNNLFYL